MRRIARIAALLSPVLLVLVMLGASTPASAQIRITVAFGPPALPVYDQPICPGDGYLWTPGYWAWDPDAGDYYWVPGTWVLAPEVGFLWTPPWWGWDGGVFLFHEGWWGPHIGFYGGINYGFGYFGTGFVGGRWDGGRFFYNREVTNINVVNIHNVYNEHVNVTVNHISYNGGEGGIVARPRPEEEAAARDRHIAAVAAQTAHIQQARADRDLRASVNQGRPSIAATNRPGDFSGAHGAREAGAPYRAPARGNTGGGNASPVHPKELPAFERPAAPNTGNADRDRKYQQQQDKMYARQEQERQNLQQKQEQEHQRNQNASPERQQQMEQKHQQQTQQLQQRHQQEQQQMQQRQSSGGRRK